ncbi:hypothetical protein Tco_0619649 [Tanacetum coccineum]
MYQRWKNAIYEDALRKSDQMYQTFEKSSLEMTNKLDVLIELPKSRPKKTYEEDLECEMFMVKKPRCMSWLGFIDAYDEPIEVEETLGTPMEEEPLDQTQLEDASFDSYDYNLSLSSREVPSIDKPEPQPLPSFSPLDVNLGEKRGTDPPIKPHSPDSFRIKAVDHLTIHTPHLPHVALFHPKGMYYNYHPCIDDRKKHYGFKTGLLRSLAKSFSNSDVIEDNFLGEGLSLPVIFDKKKLWSS